MIRCNFFKAQSIDLHKIRRACTISFLLTDLQEAKKRGNVALRKEENKHHDPTYKLERQ